MIEKEKCNIDIFVLDVEGYEINVIEGMLNSKYLPKIICAEYSFAGLENLKNILKQKYDFHSIFSNNAIFKIK